MAKYIIIGAGVGGLFSARALVAAGVAVTDIIILEKEAVVGGKCHTYRDPQQPTLHAEYGAALIAHNYGIVLDAIFEKKLALEIPLPTNIQDLDFIKQFKAATIFGKLKFLIAFTKELLCYEKHVWKYKCYQKQHLPLPEEFELPFFEFAKRKGLNKFNDLLRPIVSGFGYGAMQTCPTSAVLEYLGYTTIAGMLPALFGNGSFYTIRNGFQVLLEAIAEDFLIVKEATIIKIKRDNGIQVDYIQHATSYSISGNYLILAISPLQWSQLGMNLTKIEKQCLNNLTYYRYPVAICRLKGYPAQQKFFEDNLHPHNFGKLALITTHDKRINPPDGRLCTIYVNLKPGQIPYHSDNSILIKQLHALPQVHEATLLDQKIWEDHMCYLPSHLRSKLQEQQFAAATQTGYVNSCLSFEDVVCVATQATELIAKQFPKERKKIFKASLWRQIARIKSLISAHHEAININ